MRIYILSTNYRKNNNEYFITCAVTNKRKFYCRTRRLGEYPTIISRYETKNGCDVYNKIKSSVIPLTETDLKIINYDNDIDDYGFWIKMNSMVLYDIVKNHIDMANTNIVETALSDALNDMVIGKKRNFVTIDPALVNDMNNMSISKKSRNNDDAYMADIEN